MDDRTRCLVPGCGHTKATRLLREGDTQWICADHWRGVPRTTRSAYSGSRRGKGSYGPGFWWGECRRIAIERAAGL